MVTHKRRTGTLKALKKFARPSALQLSQPTPVIQPIPIVQPSLLTPQRTESNIADHLGWIIAEIAKTMWKQSSPTTFYVNQAAAMLAASPHVSAERRGLLHLVAFGAFLKGCDETATKIFGDVSKQKRRR